MRAALAAPAIIFSPHAQERFAQRGVDACSLLGRRASFASVASLATALMHSHRSSMHLFEGQRRMRTRGCLLGCFSSQSYLSLLCRISPPLFHRVTAGGEAWGLHSRVTWLPVRAFSTGFNGLLAKVGGAALEMKTKTQCKTVKTLPVGLLKL